MIFQSIFPYTQEVIAQYPVMDDAAINKSIAAVAYAKEFYVFNFWPVNIFCVVARLN